MKEVTKKLYRKTNSNAKAPIPCPFCNATVFFARKNSSCKNLEFICPKCGEMFIIDELTPSQPIKDNKNEK